MRRTVAASLAVATAAAGLAVVAGPAQADTSPSPAGPTNPETVSATPLPTVQINGVVWSQAIIGNTVYVAGEFSQARPAGAAPGVNETPRDNLLAYDIRTGELLDSWAASANAPVQVVEASPDGSRVYIGGQFTEVNGLWNPRIAALDPATGRLLTGFRPAPDAQVKAIAFGAQDTVFFGGNFGAVGGQNRSGVAAVRASDGALLDWAPRAGGGGVWALAVSPDGSQVLAGGSFTKMNGSDKPGRGLASLDAVTGANRRWAANDDLIRSGGDQAAITGLASHGSSVYATGYSLATGGGTLEGTVRMAWDGGRVEWMEDCHGDSYSLHIQDDAVYVASHAHYCGNIPGGFHASSPWEYYRSLAFTEQTTGTLRADYSGTRRSFAGTPAPSLLHWFPRIDGGTYTGMDQGSWSVTGNGDYLVHGGEFPKVGTLDQQGLVRFAKKGVAGNPNSTGPAVGSSEWAPTVTSPGSGEALVSWRSNWDRDNVELTYQVRRTDAASKRVVYTTTGRSTSWSRPYLNFRDTGLVPGATVSYLVKAIDPDGNETWSQEVPLTVSGTGTGPDAYARSVLASGPQGYWRMDEPSGSTVADYTGLDDASAGNRVTRAVDGAIDGNAATEFAGSSRQTAATGTARTSSFASSVEAWVKTTSRSGGKIAGLGRAGGPHLFMDNAGRAVFGVWQGSYRVVTSGSGLNDGKWHHLVGTVGDDGLVLYVDAKKVDSRTDTTAVAQADGDWRIGGDNLSGWPYRPSSDYFTGTIDEVAVYAHQLTEEQVGLHLVAGGGTLPAVEPGAPESVSAVGGDGQATVSWAAPAFDGRSPLTGYVVRAYAAGGTSAVRKVSVDAAQLSTPVTGLSNGTAYTFAVTARNQVGEGPAASSAEVTPMAPVVPGVPGSVSGLAGDGLVRVSWVAPESDGGSPVTGYVVEVLPSGGGAAVRSVSVAGSVRSASVSGLVNGSSYVVRVAAVNAVGRGEWSASSGSVTPVAAVLPARLSGGSRYETAVAVSREFFGPGVGQVVVASGENYPDALAVGPVAARRGAPVLLTPRSAVPSGVMAELRRLDPASIVLVGGTGAVSAGVERQLAGVAPVRRVWGASRYDTANAVAQLGGKAQVAYLATGENFPDALAATPSAVARNAPLLLSPRSGVPGSVLATLRSLGVSRVVLVGGTGALSPAVEATLVKAGLQVSRVAGASRYDTARLLSAGTFDSAPWAFLATGENFPDALAAGAVAGARGVPMLLTSTRCLSGVTASEIRRLGAPSLVGLGGTGALSTRALTGTTC